MEVTVLGILPNLQIKAMHEADLLQCMDYHAMAGGGGEKSQ